MKYRLAFVLGCVLIAGGCGTVLSKRHHRAWGCPYSGIEMDRMALYFDPYFLLLSPIDFPLSLVADTILLPADLTMRSNCPRIEIERRAPKPVREGPPRVCANPSCTETREPDPM